MRKTKILAVNIWSRSKKTDKPKQSAVDWWRVKNPYTELGKHGFDITFQDHFVEESTYQEWSNLAFKYKILVTSYLDHPQTYAWIKALTEMYRLKHIIDIDDNPFEVDEMNPVYIRYGHGTQDRENLLKILRDVPYMTTSTPYLKNYFENIRQKPVFLAPNFIDKELYSVDFRTIPEHKDKIIIGYQGSSTHHNDIFKTGFIWAIRKLLKKYPQVQFAICGGILSDLDKYIPKERTISITGSSDFYGWIDVWKKLPYDIGVAPLQQSLFNRGKSPIKYYEYAMRKIPGVYTFHDPYYNSVKENRTGFLANDEAEWFHKLSWLIENKELRNKIATNAYEDVTNHFTIDKNYQVWENIINQLS